MSTKTFASMLQKDASTVMIVDALNLAFRWYHKKQYVFVDEYINTVKSFARSFGAGKVIIAADSGSSRYRKEIYPAYKANRQEKRDAATPEENAEFLLFFEEYTRVLEALKADDSFLVLQFDKTEADDIAAYIVRNEENWFPDKNLKIKLISSDKDWDLLISGNVSRFSYVTRKDINLENWHEHYDWLPEEYIAIKCLQGDAGDNVIGVPGIGPKKAHTLVKEYGTIYDIAANLPITSKYVYIKNLNAFGADALMLNCKLMDLLEFCGDAIGPQNCAATAALVKEYINDFAD